MIEAVLVAEPSQTKFCRVIFLAALVFAVAAPARAERSSTRAYTTSDGLAHNRVSWITRDSRGFLWFCTGDGLSRFDGSRFTNYNVEEGLPSTSINYLIEARNGTYWIATNGGGVARLNSSGDRPISQANSQSRFTVYSMSNDAVANRVNVLFEDSDQVLWAGTDGGLFRLDQANGDQRFHSVELNIPSRPDRSVQIWAFVEGNDHSLWIGTKFGLVHRLVDGRMIHYQIQPGNTGDNVSGLIRDLHGNLWLAHDTGVFVFNPTPEIEFRLEPGRSVRADPVRRYSTDSRPGSRVRMIFQSTSGQVWVSDAGR